MDARFRTHNAHLEAPEAFAELDPQLRRLRQLPLVHEPALLHRLPGAVPGIYSIVGGRQIGKTTLLKQWMARLLASGQAPESIAYFTGELIDDHHSLVRLVSDQLRDSPPGTSRFVLIDEVTYIKDWDRGVKFLADSGELENTVLMLTGSDLGFIREARMRFPGRRGTGDVVDFHLHPLSFRETVLLKGSLGEDVIEGLTNDASGLPPVAIDQLFDAFDDYLKHGGFLTAINDLAEDGCIRSSTLLTYSDWIRGDMLKRGKQESYLREVLRAVIRRMGGQVTWNALAKDLSIDHPQTIASYVELLSSMDVLLVQPALVEDKLTAAPKKARKLCFSDPFIHHAIAWWFKQEGDAHDQIIAAVGDPEVSSKLAEACAVAQVHRRYPTYYIKAAGEVDIAYVEGDRFWPIEVKWRRQGRPKDLNQVAKYDNARLWGRFRRPTCIRGVQALPLPLALLRFGA